jgi:2-keto-4-pentenoate hydratase/2-oxohepta-3-ene-1,7-dioic acid hydratase in catechol pathway
VKIFRHGAAGEEKPGIISKTGRLIDVSSFGEDCTESLFAERGLDRLASWFEAHGSSCPEVAPKVRLGAPFARPSKIVCIGLNYREHARETNTPIPEEPVIFMKATTALIGPNDDVEIPRGSQKTDWEVELAVVIGKRAKYVETKDAMGYVAGFTVHNDYSEREFQLERGGQWDKGKGADTFAPMGPCLVTPGELDPSALDLWLKVNGEMMQRGNTSDMIFGVPKLISYVSHFMTLLPGDVISTGTPPGVGLARNPPLYLKAGDVVECGIDGIGQTRQRIVAAK